MPDIYRTQNPLEYTQLEGVIVTERQPPLGVIAAGANNCIFLGQFRQGPKNQPTLVTSVGELSRIYGNDQSYSGNQTFRLKGWSNVYVVRVVADDAVKSSLVLQDASSNDLLTLTAKDEGEYGNEIEVSVVDDVSGTGKRVTINREGVSEVYTEVETAGKSNAELLEIFRSSALVDVTGAHATIEIENVASSNLASGSDGNISGSEYATALDNANIKVSGKVYFADNQSAPVKAALSNLVKTERDGICVIGSEDASTGVDDAISDAAIYQDNEGRVLYAYNHIGYNIGGTIEHESPVGLLASILNLSAPNIDPSSTENQPYTATAVNTRNNLGRGDLIKLRDGGVMAFENDGDLGIRVVSSVTGNENVTVLRRRVSDFYIDSVARFLKNYQGHPNSNLTRASIKAAIANFDNGLVVNGVLPADNSISDELGNPIKTFQVKTEGLTTLTEQAQGILKVQIKRRIYASARFIVLIATIGESVLIEEEG